MRKIKAIKTGPKRIATSTGKPDQRQRDNKGTPGNTPELKHRNQHQKNRINIQLPIIKKL